MKVTGFVDQARHLGRCLGDVENEHAPTARDIVKVGHEGLLLVSLAPGRPVDPIPATGPERQRRP